MTCARVLHRRGARSVAGDVGEVSDAGTARQTVGPRTRPQPTGLDRAHLPVAAKKGSLEVAEALLEAGADLGAELAHGGTPLAAAAREGQVQMVGFLLERGADPATPNRVALGTHGHGPQERREDPQAANLIGLQG